MLPEIARSSPVPRLPSGVAPIVPTKATRDAGYPRNLGIDALKGAAIVAVVLHHVDNQRFAETTHRSLQAMTPWIAWAVFAFFFASGYLHATSRSRMESTGTFIRVRARRLLIPYALISGTYAVLAEAIQRSSNEGTLTHSTSLSDKLVAILKGSPLYGEQMYFFPLLFLASVGFQCLWSVGGRATRPLWTVGVFAAVVAGLTLGRGHTLGTSGWSLDTLAAGMLEYSIGFVMGSRTVRDRTQLAMTLCLIGVCAAIAAAADWRFAMLPVPSIAFEALRRIVRPTRLWWPVLMLGTASGTIFAYHTPFPLQTMLAVLLRAGVPDLVNVFVSAGAVIVACTTLHLLLGRSPRFRWAQI